MRTYIRLVLALTALLLIALPAVPAAAKGRDDHGPQQQAARDDRGKGADKKPDKPEKTEPKASKPEPKAEPKPNKSEREAKGPEHGERLPKHAESPACFGGRTPPPAGAAQAEPSAPAPAPPSDPAAIAPAPPAEPANPRRFSYGASLADVGRNGPLLKGMGFNMVKSYLPWSGAEPSKGAFNWADADNLVHDAERHGLQLVIRVDTPPAWAAPGTGNRPPTNPGDYADFMGALASHLRGHVVAYELWNEPNLAGEWGGLAPDPERFTRLLQAAYPLVKAADPGALVVSGGLATTGGDGGTTAMDDLRFIERMYQAGAAGSFDALGSHPYGFATAPDSRAADGASDFQRAADQYAAMVEHGDGDKAIWATEVGWLVDPGAFGQGGYLNDPSWAGRQWQKVDPATQAQNLVRAYQHAYEKWPWMGAMLLFNLDFSTVTYYSPAEQMRWYAVVNQDGSARPAFDALRGMAKPSR
jgi:hypothetical protein